MSAAPVEAVAVCAYCGRALCVDCAKTSGSKRMVCSTACDAALTRNDRAMQMILQKNLQSARASAFYSFLCGGLSAAARRGRVFLSARAVPDLVHSRLQRRLHRVGHLVWPDCAKTKFMTRAEWTEIAMITVITLVSRFIWPISFPMLAQGQWGAILPSGCTSDAPPVDSIGRPALF